MDAFDNFQSESASSYGGGGGADDDSSVYTANTRSNLSVNLESLSISDYPSASSNAPGHGHRQNTRGPIDEDYDGVLDDLKEEGAVALPPHACRQANH
jgi:regulator of nonsense transcripts 1